LTVLTLPDIIFPNYFLRMEMGECQHLQAGPLLGAVRKGEHVGGPRGAAVGWERLPEQLHVVLRVRDRAQEVPAPACNPFVFQAFSL
jgi:hypothetical protein